MLVPSMCYLLQSWCAQLGDRAIGCVKRLGANALLLAGTFPAVQHATAQRTGKNTLFRQEAQAPVEIEHRST